jgi:hypothetical protein
MKNVAANARFWIAGTFVALAGVALARGVAPSLGSPARLYCTVGGQLLALSGLVLLAYGVSRRVRRDGESAQP